MGRTVLVVEDDDAIQEVLGLVLESEGYEVVATRDGLEALQQLEREQRQPALILLDWRMPGMDGGGFAKAVRGMGARVPILVLTADGRAEQPSAELGAEGYLRKPFDVSVLLDEVARLAGA